MPPKRKPNTAATANQASKRQKGDTDSEEWDHAAAQLKAIFESAKANERIHTEELEKQMNVNQELKNKLKKTDGDLKHEKEEYKKVHDYAVQKRAQYVEQRKQILEFTRQSAEKEQLQEPRQKVIDAAGQVKKLMTGMPVENMGPLGEALKMLESAYSNLQQADLVEREDTAGVNDSPGASEANH